MKYDFPIRNKGLA